MNKNLGGQEIQFEEWDLDRTQKYLERELRLPEMLVLEAMDVFRLINNGKLNFVSHDEKKTIGTEPVPIDRFVQDFKRRFLPGKQGPRV